MRAIGLALVLSQILVSTAVFAQSTSGTGGGVSGRTTSTGAASGGSLGTSAGAPGTNSAGTAAPSSGAGMTTGSGAYGLLGTGDPAVDKHEKDVSQKVRSICKGC